MLTFLRIQTITHQMSQIPTFSDLNIISIMNDALTNKAKMMLETITGTIKLIAISHKKKLIFLVAVLLAGYIAKKKLTMAHLINIFEFMAKAMQYLPLPQDQKLRKIGQYEHSHLNPLKSILEAIKLDDIRKKIANKQSTWQELKQSILIGSAATMTIYNVQSIYCLIQNKYKQDFLQLQASTQFDEAIYNIRKTFVEQIPNLFNYFKQNLSAEIHRIQLLRNYTIQQLDSVFQELIAKIFSGRFNLEGEVRRNSSKISHQEARNRYFTPYEYVQQKKTMIGTIFNGIMSLFGGVLKIHQFFPEPKVELTLERYQIVKSAFVLSLKKSSVQHLNWPNKTSQDLFRLVFEQMNDLLLSVNFSTLILNYAKYNLTILKNRIRLFLIQKARTTIKFSELLPTIYKILQQQFMKANQLELRDKYHDSQIKKGLKTIVQVENKEDEEEQMEDYSKHKNIDIQILKEIEAKNIFQFLQKEVELKYFNQRSGVVIRPKKGGEKNESKDMQKLLNMIGGSQALNQTD